MKKKIALILLFIFSLAVRLYQINSVPAILNRDEAALAYNAYLLAETGYDEWHRAWPLSLESFGDYKLPGYVYVLMGLFKALPLTDWVVKLPSIIAGAALVVLAFFFAKAVRLREIWAGLFAILIATAPVFFFYSRIAFEANLALTLFIAALTMLLIKTSAQKRIFFDSGAILLILFSVFTYNTPLLLLPFILPILILVRGAKLWKKWLTPVLGISLVMMIAGYQLLSLSAQKSSITIFQDETSWNNSVIFRQQFAGHWQSILGNKYVYYASLIGKNYLKTISPNFLVNAQGGHPWHSLPNHGHLLGIVYFFGMIGIVVTLYDLTLALKKKQFSNKIRIRASLIYLLFVSLLPAVVTVDAPHATRSLLFFFLFNLFTLFGLKRSYHLVRDHTQIKKNALFISFGLLLIVSSFNYFENYFINYPRQQESLKPGFEEILAQVENRYPTQEIVVIDDEGYQYILLAWYLKISPQDFFETTVRQLPDKIGFRYGQQVGRYHFIARLDDRIETEKIAINWNELTAQWEILEF